MDASTAPTRPVRATDRLLPALWTRAGGWFDAHPHWTATLLYLLAVVARAPYLASFRDPRLVRAPFMDEAFYHAEAWSILRGAPPASDAYFMTPLYPWFLSVVFRIVGDGAVAPYAVQMAFASLVVPLTWWVGRQALRPQTAFVTAALLATFAPLAFFEALYLVEWSILLVLTAALACAVATSRRCVWAVLTGIAIGIATLGRGTNALLLPIVAAWFWFDRAPGPARPALCRAVACVLACAVVLAPLVVRNLRHAESPLFLTANLGFNLWVGNGPDANGIFVRTPGLDLQQDPLTMRYVQRHVRRPVTASETSVWWLARTREWVRAHPGRTLHLLAWKMMLFWNRQSIPQVEGFEAVALDSPLARPPFWRGFAFLPLALVGSLWCLRRSRLAAPAAEVRRDRVRRLLAVTLWVYAGSIALFFITDRYRVPSLACAMLLAAVALETFAGWTRRETAGRRAVLALAVAAVVAAFWVTSPARIGIDQRRMHRDLQIHAALRAAEAGRFEEALARYELAREYDPADPEVLDGRARMLARAGRDRDAVTAFEHLLAARPDDARSWYNFGNVHRRSGRDSSALAAYQRSLALEPEREAAWNQLGEVYRALGDTARAADAYRSALALAPAYELALNNLAALRAQQGDAVAAEAGFRAARKANPRYVPALVNLALLLGDANPETRVLWQHVLAVDPDNTLARDKLQVHVAPGARPQGP